MHEQHAETATDATADAAGGAESAAADGMTVQHGMAGAADEAGMAGVGGGPDAAQQPAAAAQPQPAQPAQPAQTVGEAIPQETLQRTAAASGMAGGGMAGGAMAGTADAASGVIASDPELVMRIPVTLQAVLGEARMSIARLMKLGPGSVVPLDHKVGDPVDVVVNGKLVARGEVVLLEGEGERFGISLTEIVSPRRETCS